MDSSYFNDERNDIFELSTAPKVLQLYRGDTHVVYVNLKVPSSAINSIVFNCDGLPDATALTLESTTLTTSSWKLTLNKSQTLILLPKTHNFTMTVIGLDLTELTLYKGLVIANNRTFSNSSNNYYLSPLIKFVAPTIADNAYQIGTIWIDVVLNRVHVFTSLNDDDEAYWLDVTKLIRDALVGDEPFTAINLNNEAMLTFNGTDVVWSYRGINAEMFKNLILEVEPASGVTFTNGMCVMYAGSIGGSGKRLAKPTNFAELKLNPGLFLGVITQISDDGNGIVNWYGEVNNLNTQDLVLGSPVYVGDNGSWTTIKPTSPNPQISIGLIERAHVEQGRISVRPRINCYLSELHDVYINGHTFVGGEIIKYNFTNSRWEIFNLDGSLLTISTNISDIQGDIIDINTNLQALDLNKVDKLLTIIGLDLQNNITLDEFKIALGNATTSLDGLLSSEDKVHINNFVTLFENDSTEILDTIALILQIFETYPEGTDIMTLLEGKVDKVTGYGLSKNNLSDELKQQYDAAYTHTSDISNPHSVTKTQVGLENVEDGAQINIIEKVNIDGADLTPDVDKRITLPDKEPAFEKNTAFNKNFGNEDDTVCEGNDARLSDARTPLSHTHDDRYYTESEVDTLLGNKVDKVEGEGLITDAEKALVATIPSISLKNAEQDKQIATIEENLRRVNNGEVSATAVGERVIHLGKDVANAPLKIETEGLLLDAPNQLNLASTTQDGITITVSGNQITLSGTASADTDIVLTNLLTIGNKAYINYDYVSGSFTGIFALINDTSLHSTYNSDYSGVITVAHANVIISLASGSVATSLIIKINIDKVTSLISNKQYSPLYLTTFDLMTDEQIKTQMDLWVANSTLPNDLMGVDFNKRFTSVGKNLFNIQDLTNGTNNVFTLLSSTQFKLYNTGGAVNSFNILPKIKFEELAQYTLSGSLYETNDAKNARLVVIYTDGTSSNIATPSTIDTVFSLTTTAGKTVSYISVNYSNSGGNTIYTNFQLEVGTTATTYEPFAKSEMYIAPNVKGYRLPNGIKDTIEFRNGKHYYIQRVKKYVLQASDITTINTTYTQLDYARIPRSKLLNWKYTTVTTLLASLARISILPVGYSIKTITDDYNNSDYINHFDTGSDVDYIWVGINKGTILAEAQADLAGTDIYYQLATPIETEIDSDGVLNGYENGTVYIENALKDIAIYDSGFTITNDEYLISELETIVKIDKITGLQTAYDASTAVIAENKLSFTHSSLANGDLVYITYKYLSPLMSNTTITFIDNKQVVLGTGSSAGKYFKITPTVVDGSIVWVATEV